MNTQPNAPSPQPNSGFPANAPGFQERRSNPVAGPPGVERRQFANSHDDLSPRAQELAKAIDDYKLNHRRRFITYEEILSVLHSLGYSKTNQPTPSP